MEDRSGKGASFDAIRNLIGHPGDLEYTDALKSSFHCLDGRLNKPVLGELIPLLMLLKKNYRDFRRRYGRIYSWVNDLSFTSWLKCYLEPGNYSRILQ